MEWNNNMFFELKQRAEHFLYTSLLFCDFEDLKNYRLIEDTDSLILLSGYNYEAGILEYHFACSEASVLLEKVCREKREVMISFVPEQWVPEFEKRGFSIRAVWNDYWKENLNISPSLPPEEFLTKEYCAEASAVTLACREKSRGFTGQSPKWMENWLSGEEGVRFPAVLLHRENGKAAGIICIGLYGFDSAQGPVLWIRELAVCPEYQNRGIGRKLLLQAFQYGKEHGAYRSFLAADENNIKAIHMYRSLGFTANPLEKQIEMPRLSVI